MPKRGRLVLVGLSGLEFSKSDFYEKELSFQVSCRMDQVAMTQTMKKRKRLSDCLCQGTEQRNFRNFGIN